MVDINTIIIDYWKQGRKIKKTSSGWLSGNAVCCLYNGQTQDKRGRGGVMISDKGWSYSCFNCSYTASFVLGRNLNFKARKLLQWLKVPDRDIELINLNSMRHRSIHGMIEDRQKTFNSLSNIRFEQRPPPIDTELLNIDDPRHLRFIEYLEGRSIDCTAYPYMVSPGTQGRNSGRIVVPFTHNGVIVGNTVHYIDGKMPKYINDMQSGYVFGTDLQHDDWKFLIVTEGVFDALSISGLAVLHADISDTQAQLIRSLGREVVVVPDQDAAGLRLVDRAVELGWAVSMPNWHNTVKDVNDAVIHYGKLGALITIMQARETTGLKIQLRKRQLVKRLQ